MPQYSVDIPGKGTFDIDSPTDLTDAQAYAAVMAHLGPQKETPKEGPKEGFLPALESGFKNLQADMASLAGRSGLVDVDKAEAFRKQKQEEAQQIHKPTEKSWFEAPLTNFGELVAGSIPYMIGPALGGLAGAALAPEAAVGATAAEIAEALSTKKALSAAGTMAVSTPQFTGQFLSRQVQEGTPLAQTNLKTAVAAAVPAAALDAISLHMIPGIKNLFGEAGEQLTNAEAKKIADQGLSKTLQDYALQTGKIAGIEGTTEAAQQVFERLQAGLSLTDPDARQEYLDNFLGGAVLGGVLGVPGRFIERGAAKAQAARATQQEQRQQQIDALKAQADEESQKEAAKQQEELDKQKPEYIQNFMQNYEALQAQYKDLQKQTKKPDIKTALPADMEQYNQNKEQLKALNKQLSEGSKEYLRVRPLFNQMQAQKETEAKQREEQAKQDAEKRRIAGLTPQQYMLEQMGHPEQEELSPEEHMIQQLNGAIPQQTTEKPDPLAEYAAQNVERARGFGQTELGDYADYIMQDPAKAKQMVDAQTRIPNLTRSENSGLLSGLKLRLNQIEKDQQKAAKQELQNRNEELKQQTTTPEEDQLADYKASQEQVEEHQATAETNFDYLDPMFEKSMEGKPGAVAVDEQVKPTARAKELKNTVDSLLHQARTYDEAYWAAKRSGERAAAASALLKGREVTAQLKALSGEGSPYTRELIKARVAQDTALRDLEDLAERMQNQRVLGKESQRTLNPETGQYETTLMPYGTGMAANTMKGLSDKAEAARGQYISAVLHEAALNRRAFDKAPLTTDEALKAASAMHDTLSEWISRVQNAPKRDKVEQVMVQPAQMRAHKIIRPAQFEKRTKIDERPVRDYRFGAYDKAVQVLKEELEQQRRDISQLPNNATRVEQLLKTQFAEKEARKTAEARGETATTVGGQIRRQTEFVRNKMAKMGPMRPAARDALNAAIDIMDNGKPTQQFLEAVENLVDRIVSGRQVTQTDIRAVNDAIAAARPTAMDQKEAGQLSLFPKTEEDLGYIRATPANFAKSPRIKPVWDAIKEAQDLQAKMQKKQKVAKENTQRAMAALEDLQTQLATIKGKSKYFLLSSGEFKTSPYSNEQIAKLFVEGPTMGETDAEKALVNKKFALAPLTAEENDEFTRIMDKYNDKKAEYDKRVGESMRMLAQEIPLNSVNNKLVEFMQSSNASTRKQAAALRQETQELLERIKAIQDHIKVEGSRVFTKQEKAIMAMQTKVANQRAEYQEAVSKALAVAQAHIRNVVNELVNPAINRLSKELKKAKDTLANEEEELENINIRLMNIANQKDADRDDLLTYQLFKYEEKKDIIEDLKKKVNEQIENLDDLVSARNEEIDGAEIATQAMLDDNVKNERKYLEMLEEELAHLRGEKVTARPVGGGPIRLYGMGKVPYPFALRAAEQKAKAQQAVVKAAEKKSDDFKSETKKTKNALANLPGITAKQRALDKDTQKYLDNIDKEIDKLEKNAVALRESILNKPTKAKQKLLDKVHSDLADYAKMRTNLLTEIAPAVTKDVEKRDKEYEDILQAQQDIEDAKQREEQRRLLLDNIDKELEQTTLDFVGMEGPATSKELNELLNSDTTPKKEKTYYQRKLALLNAITSLEAQRETIIGEKPRRKPQAATVPSTSALAAAKEFRTGSAEQVSRRTRLTPEEKADKTLAQEEARIARMKTGKGVPEFEDTDFDLSGILNFGGFRNDPEFSRGTPTQGLTKKELEKELELAFGEKITGREKEAQPSRVLQVFDSVDDYIKTLPSNRADKMESIIPKDAKGFVQNGKAILFANNIGKGHGLGVLLHEVGVHIGFRNFFNEGQYKALVNAVKSWANRTDDSVEARVGRAAMDRVKMANTPASQIDDELLAYAVEEASQMGVEPAGVRGGKAVANWLRMIVDAFKKALTKFGLIPQELTAGDMVNFAYGCANLELKGTWHGTASKFDAFDHTYMSTGEGAQAYGWGTYRAQQSGIAKGYVNTALRSRLDAWKNNPEVKQWTEENETTYNGKNWEAIRDMGKEYPIGVGKKRLMPFGAANILSSALRIDSNNRTNNYFVFSPRQNIEEEVKNSLKIYEGRDKAETEKWFKDNFDSSKITGIHDKPLYQGYDKLDHYSNNENKINFAYEVLTLLQKDVSDEPLDVKIKKAIEETKKDLESTIKIFADEPTAPIYINAKTALEEAKTFNPKEVTFKQESAPPIPKPEGYLTRTIHTRPENEYLHWHEEKQSEYVNNRIEKLYDSLTAKQKEKFDASIKPATHKIKVSANPNAPARRIEIKTNPLGKDIYNAFSAAFEKNLGVGADKTASEKLFALGVPGIKFLDNPSREKNIKGLPVTYNYVDFSDKETGAQLVAHNLNPVGQTKEILFSVKPKYNTSEFEAIGAIGDRFIAKQKTFMDKVKANASGLAFETQLVDRFAGFERLAKHMEPLIGTQMMYYLRMYDQRMNFVAQSVSNGALQLVKKTRADGRVERVLESKPGPSLKSTVNTLKEANDIVGNGEAVNRLFTLYLSAIRAKDKGFAALHFGDQISEAELNQAFKKIEANDKLKEIFNRARNEYNEYNRNQIKFVVESGALSKETADRLLKENDYIPWYRERNGVAELIIGKENPIRVGSIAEQPYLHELVGGDAPILDFMTSSVQNTNILADMALRNLATKNAVFELANMDLAHIGKGKGTPGPSTVRFKDDGVDKFAIIDTDKVGVPADVLVKGMEGIPTQMPFAFRMMGIPARILRQAVTASPLYAAKQLFRDSLAAPILAGANFTPVIDSLKEINSATKATLEQRGITGGQIFTGTKEDLTKILRDMAEGKPAWLNGLAKLEAMSMEADATTRRAQYNSYLQQGLSEMEATLLSLESMNFNKRGASPSVHIVNSIIPFFNAQIQSLNVLYKAMTGKMPFNEKLKIQEKLLTRGAMIAAGTLAYAMMMQDDDAYKNATPDQKYNNWFVRVPGVDEPVRLPIPFEIGYIFKALPEALYNTMVNEHGKDEAVEAFGGIMKNLIPGGTSYGIPQAIKPAIEAGLGKSFYTGRDILTPGEQHLLPEDQFRANTTEAAKAFGKATGVSPIMLEHLVNGYTGTLGLAFLQAISFGAPRGATPEQATRRLSELPVIGGAFQPNDAGGIISNVYNDMNEFKKTKASFEERIKRGDRSGAMELLNTKGNELAMAQVADHYTTTMKKFTGYENAIRASDLSPDEKRKRLDEIRKMKIQYANMVRDASDKTTRQ